MEYRECEDCHRTYGYFDSPPAKKCFCGGDLKVTDSPELINYFGTEFATVSC